MTLTDLIPALRGHGSHRAADEVDRLRASEEQARAALARAGRENGELKQRLAVAENQRAQALLAVAYLFTAGARLRSEQDRLQYALDATQREVLALRADDANRNAITPPPFRPIGDNSPENTTVVRALPDAAAAGLL